METTRMTSGKSEWKVSALDINVAVATVDAAGSAPHDCINKTCRKERQLTRLPKLINCEQEKTFRSSELPASCKAAGNLKSVMEMIKSLG